MFERKKRHPDKRRRFMALVDTIARVYPPGGVGPGWDAMAEHAAEEAAVAQQHAADGLALLAGGGPGPLHTSP